MESLRECERCGTVYLGDVCPGCPEPASAACTIAPKQSFRGFEILEEIGHGGMGVVYKARQASLDRIVALKVLSLGSERRRELQARFEREAKLLASLSHPHIVTIFDYGQEEDLFFFTMEFVEGTSLRSRIQEGRVPLEEALRMLDQLCDGLAFAHEHGIVHRDIKPENLLLDRHGRIKILDFGVAKLLEEKAFTLTQSGMAMGTYRYMAPEQLDDARRVDHRADIYASGVVLYEMLTGRHPQGAFDPPSKSGIGDARLDEAIAKALAADPSRRFSSAAEFRSALAATRLPAPVEQRRRRPGWIVALVLVAILVAIALILWPRRESVPPAEVRKPEPLQPADADPAVVRAALSGAIRKASIGDGEAWMRMLYDPDGTDRGPESTDSSISFLLLSQRPPRDVSFPLLSSDDLRVSLGTDARTVISPSSIEKITYDIEGETLRGSCDLAAPSYKASIAFRAVKTSGQWEVVEFSCPLGGEKTVRGSDGEWQATWPALSLLDRLRFGLLDNPLGAAPLEPLSEESERWHAFLDSVVEREGTIAGRGFMVRWPGCTLVVVEATDAEAARRVLAWKPRVPHAWSHVAQTVAVLAFGRRSEDRSAFVDLVQRVQRKLGLVVQSPDLPLANLRRLLDPLPQGWCRKERDPQIRGHAMPFVGSTAELIQTFLRSRRGLPNWKAEDVVGAYCDAFENGVTGETVRLTAVEFRDVAAAARIEQEIRSHFPWPRTQNALALRAARTVAILMTDSVRGDFDLFVPSLRSAMGFLPLTFDSVIPTPAELPEGVTYDGIQRGRYAVLQRAGLAVRLAPDQVRRAFFATLKPEGTLLIVETDRGSFPLIDGALRCAVQSSEAVEQRMKGRFGLPLDGLPTPPLLSYVLRSTLTMSESAAVRSLLFDPTGGTLYVETQRKLQRVDTIRGTSMADWDDSGLSVYGLTLSPDGETIGKIEGTAVRFLSTRTGELTPRLEADVGPVEDLEFSPDGRRMAIVGKTGTSIRDVENGKEIRLIRWAGVRAAYDPTGSVLAIATGAGKIKLCDLESGATLYSLSAHDEGIEDLAFHPDGAILASWSGDRTIRLWDVRTGKRLRTLDAKEWVRAITFRSDSVLVSCGDKTVTLWDPEQGEPLEVYEVGARCVAVSRDGKRIAAGDNRGYVYLWERTE